MSKVKGGNWRIFQNIQRGQGYTARLPGEGKSVLNKRERNVLDIHYGLMKAPPLMQIYADLRLGFWIRICLSIGLSVWRSGGLEVWRSVGLSVCRSVGLSVCLSVWLSGTATFFFLPDALSVS